MTPSRLREAETFHARAFDFGRKLFQIVFPPPPLLTGELPFAVSALLELDPHID